VVLGFCVSVCLCVCLSVSVCPSAEPTAARASLFADPPLRAHRINLRGEGHALYPVLSTSRFVMLRVKHFYFALCV